MVTVSEIEAAQEGITALLNIFETIFRCATKEDWKERYIEQIGDFSAISEFLKDMGYEPSIDESQSQEEQPMTTECLECGDFFVPESENQSECAGCQQQKIEESHDDGNCVENCPVCTEEGPTGA
ncbi:hypothetical protein LCGC14_1751530 [marine sediment metagenome]|uniref:Uncharacterized protein n=1 Tax=marine sediment metagenome TaxID=412755 RepID=A0A0F9H3U2_9ZZZZ